MAFMTFQEVILFRKKTTLNFALFFFVYLFPGFINKRSHNTVVVFEEGAIEHILRAKVWLHRFERVFWQNLTDFLFAVYLLFFF